MRAGRRAWPDAETSSALRSAKFARFLEAASGRGGGSTGGVVDVEGLRALAWSGVPACYRVATWQTLLGYLPPNRERAPASLAAKLREYQLAVGQYFAGAAQGAAGASVSAGAGSGAAAARGDVDQALLRQVLVDVPRTSPDIALFRCDWVQRSLERVLYVWAMRHPASGYVQGINDLATPFYAVFLSPWVDTDARDLAHVPPAALLDVEADVYWCLTKLLDAIQDHYTPSQPGIQRMIYRLRELVHRIDGEERGRGVARCGRAAFRQFCARSRVSVLTLTPPSPPLSHTRTHTHTHTHTHTQHNTTHPVTKRRAPRHAPRR